MDEFEEDGLDEEGLCPECGCELEEGCHCEPKCDYCSEEDEDDFAFNPKNVYRGSAALCESCQ